MDLSAYTSGHIESFLVNYEVFVQDLAELAAEWASLDAEARSDQQSFFIQVWGNRHVLGRLYDGHRLTHPQVVRLAKVDQILLEQASLMEQCFGVDLAHLLTLFHWGTPLAESSQPVRIDTDTGSLNQLAQALVEAH